MKMNLNWWTAKGKTAAKIFFLKFALKNVASGTLEHTAFLSHLLSKTREMKKWK